MRHRAVFLQQHGFLVSISAENYTSTWYRSNATGILFMHTDVTQWRVQSKCVENNSDVGQRQAH